MNRIFLAVTAFLFANNLLFAQNGNGNSSESGNSGNALIHWKLNGNQATNSHFFGTVNEADLIFKTYSAERLRITKDGQIGIGVEAPMEKLHIDGAIRLNKDIIFSKYALTEGGESRFIGIDNNGKTAALTLSDLKSLIFSSDCFSKGGLSSSDIPGWAYKVGAIYTGSQCPAKVGINTDTPTTTLHVEGSGYFSNNFSIGINGGGTETSGMFRVAAPQGTRLFNLINTSTNKSVFSVRGSGLVEIRATADENSKLLVLKNNEDGDIFRVYGNGTVWATEVNVALRAEFPDYVFTKDYNLMPLEDLSNYINTNNRLPNIPSAKEIKENGLNLGEVQRLQMEKIEELTLYILELKKEIEELKNNKN